MEGRLVGGVFKRDNWIALSPDACMSPEMGFIHEHVLLIYIPNGNRHLSAQNAHPPECSPMAAYRI